MKVLEQALNSRCTRAALRAALHIALALTASGLISAHASTDDQSSNAQAPKRHAAHHVAAPSLDDRVKILTKALDLDAKQQSELKKVLEDQREQIARIWNDASVPGARRVIETQALSEKAADQIRALLNDEQRKKYNPPKPPREATAASSPSVEDWMNKSRSK